MFRRIKIDWPTVIYYVLVIAVGFSLGVGVAVMYIER